MSTISQDRFPEVGDLVIATIDRITEYGAYVTLDEYGKEGFLHISEISSSWIRNIKDFIREGQKTVLKVLRVNIERNQIDLSLRRVSKRERIEKLLAWNLDRKAQSILNSVSKRLDIPLEKVRAEVEEPLVKKYGNLYTGFEEVVREGIAVLHELNIPKELAEVVFEVVKEKIKLPSVKITGIIELKSMKPDGVKVIKEALLSAEKIRRKGVKIKVYVVSPPRYRIEVTARDYQSAEKALKEASEAVLNTIKEKGGYGSFKREK